MTMKALQIVQEDNHIKSYVTLLVFRTNISLDAVFL